MLAQVGGVEGGGGGGVAGGGADGQHLAGPGLAHQVVEVAQGRGHAPVLEGGAGVLAVVFEIKGPADFFPQGLVGRHLGGVAFAQVDDVFQGDDRGDQFIEEMNALQGRDIEHLAVIEEPPPEGPGVLFQAVGGLVFQQKQALALGAGIEQLADIVFRPAFETAVDQVAFRLGDEMRADVVGELFGFQGASSLKAQAGSLCYQL